ncbi:MAG: hypothetical protein ABIG44_15530 [Planctomycetota bacterium]
MFRPFTRTERDGFLNARREALQKYNQAADQADACVPWSEDEARALATVDQHRARLAQVERDYFERLPRLPMSPCPLCGRPLYRSFDPFGLDGLWWRADATPEEVPSCPHFCVLVGALSFGNASPSAGDFEVHPGPQAPYVIPRILELPTVIAVVGEIEMVNGYRAYPIAYFAEQRPAPEDLTAGWARPVFTYRRTLGEGGWRVPNDLWDFDLLPWLQRDKLRWCEPGSKNARLSTPSPDQCPYLNLPGERQRMIVQGANARPAGLPDGSTWLPPGF